MIFHADHSCANNNLCSYFMPAITSRLIAPGEYSRLWAFPRRVYHSSCDGICYLGGCAKHGNTECRPVGRYEGPAFTGSSVFRSRSYTYTALNPLFPDISGDPNMLGEVVWAMFNNTTLYEPGSIVATDQEYTFNLYELSKGNTLLGLHLCIW
jgi:hypothetical protein